MAGEDTEKAILIDPSDVRGHSLKASLLAECMDFDGAVDAAKVAVTLDSGGLFCIPYNNFCPSSPTSS
jgi:hypothetical protein